MISECPVYLLAPCPPCPVRLCLLGVEDRQIGRILGEDEGICGWVERVFRHDEFTVGVRLRLQNTEVTEEDIPVVIHTLVGLRETRYGVLVVPDAVFPQSLVDSRRGCLRTIAMLDALLNNKNCHDIFL